MRVEFSVTLFSRARVLARVEVLRGPQWTLYGASSMGGLIKFVTVDPSTEDFSGRIQAGTSAIHNGTEPGYSVRGSINVPVTEVLAVRASAFSREDPGYVDNPVLDVNGINKTVVDGGRVPVLWKPGNQISLKVSALYQDLKADGSSDVDNSGLPVTWDRRWELYSRITCGGLAALSARYRRSAPTYRCEDILPMLQNLTGAHLRRKSIRRGVFAKSAGR
jgi:outer membrane receptor protein involved in Fe transport